MPGSWSDGDAVGDDDADDGDLTPPIHPDDRLWRHPSEVDWAEVGPSPDPGDEPARPVRVWALAITSALTGAALALATVALVGAFDTSGTTSTTTTSGSSDVTLLRRSDVSPTGLAAVAEAVLPSVVRIEVDGATGHTTGTGVVVVADGHVLTNAHVISGATSVSLVVADGTAVPARVVGVDPVTDVAVVAPADGHAGDATWTPARRGSAAGLEVGQAVVTVGAAGDGSVPSIAFGVVAALGRRVATAAGDTLHGMIQTDTPVAPTATGGALCDEAGAVVGLSTTRTDENGTGYATPIDEAWAVAEILIAEGEVHHAWLGIEGSDRASNDDSAIEITGAATGVLVERVLDASPAEAAGIAEGDVLLEVDGEPLTSMSDLVLALRAHRPGDEVLLSVVRGEDLVRLRVTLTER